jgi:hypothetical protein
LQNKYGVITATSNPEAAVDESRNNGNLARTVLRYNNGQSQIVQNYIYDEVNRLKEAREYSNIAITPPTATPCENVNSNLVINTNLGVADSLDFYTITGNSNQAFAGTYKATATVDLTDEELVSNPPFKLNWSAAAAGSIDYQVGPLLGEPVIFSGGVGFDIKWKVNGTVVSRFKADIEGNNYTFSEIDETVNAITNNSVAGSLFRVKLDGNSATTFLESVRRPQTSSNEVSLLPYIGQVVEVELEASIYVNPYSGNSNLIGKKPSALIRLNPVIIECQNSSSQTVASRILHRKDRGNRLRRKRDKRDRSQ